MPERFSRLEEANRLSQAYTRYAAWVADAPNRPRRVGQGTPRSPAVEIAITPFGFDIPASSAVRATTTQAARQQMGTQIGAYGTATLTGLTLNRIPGFKAARITLFVGTGSRTTPTSQITGLEYLKYSGRSYSHPFGMATGTDLEYDTFTQLRTALLGPNKRVSYSPERRQVIV